MEGKTDRKKWKSEEKDKVPRRDLMREVQDGSGRSRLTNDWDLF